MLNQSDIDEIAVHVARKNLPEGALISASSQPHEGPYGDDELMVSVKIRVADFDKVTGRQFNLVVGDLQQELVGRGELRPANIRWETDAEPRLDADGN